MRDDAPRWRETAFGMAELAPCEPTVTILAAI